MRKAFESAVDQLTGRTAADINWDRGKVVGLGGPSVGDRTVMDVPVAALDAAHKATDPGMYVTHRRSR